MATRQIPIPVETLEKLRDAYIAHEIERENPGYLLNRLLVVVESVLEDAGMLEECRKAIVGDFERRVEARKKGLGLEPGERL